MRAVIITRPGGPEVLEVRELPTPKPAADQVLVRVYAAGLNRADILQRRGHYPPPPGAAQDIPGMEFAGEIAEVGPDARLAEGSTRLRHRRRRLLCRVPGRARARRRRVSREFDLD